MIDWIKCSERLPPVNEWVLCVLECHGPCPISAPLRMKVLYWTGLQDPKDGASYSDLPWHDEDDDFYLIGDVSHWQPLPEPPRD